VGKVTYGGEEWQQQEAKRLMEQLGTVLSEDLLKSKSESKAPLFRIDLREGYRQARTRPLKRRSHEEQKVIDDFITVMVKAGMIEECRVPYAASL
jgi:hypothetical protein